MAAIANRIPVKVWPIDDPNVAHRIRNRIPIRVNVIAAPAPGEITNTTPMRVIVTETYPADAIKVEPLNVYESVASPGPEDTPNADPVLVYVVSGSLGRGGE